MRATIEGIEINGTPAEIAELLKSIQQQNPTRKKHHVASLTASESGNGVEVDQESEQVIPESFAYRTLKRLPLSKNQKALLEALKSAHSGWMLGSDIQSRFNWSGTQLGGVLGGLGRRLTATKGYKSGYELWNWKWDDDEGEYAYQLPEAVIAALDRLE